MKQIRTQNQELQQFQDNVSEVLRPLEACALIQGGKLVENVVLGVNATNVAHGLDRRLRGWFVVRTNGTSTVYEPSVSTMPDRFVNLKATGAVVVTLWVF